ncbi:hypothetical protein MFIFM68171_04710 [Madurella fahalii]|uniref:F-box domain-containing protein n=1 Tax=Madurella fahalii TaxID=1157608 RepID=A0ABQ0G9W9_9PEZI
MTRRHGPGNRDVGDITFASASLEVIATQQHSTASSCFQQLPAEILLQIWELAERDDGSRSWQRRPTRLNVYRNMSLVCKRFRTVVTAYNLTHRNLCLFTNSPGNPFNWMLYLRKTAFI